MPSTDAPIEIADYDASWPARFEQEAGLLARALAPWLVGPLAHIGSTAVPGLAAKPVIDIMGRVESLDASRPAIAAATAAGYCYSPYRPDKEHWFCKPSFAFRTHHLHLVPADSAQWKGAIAFRDHLRAHPEVATEYEAMKRQLAVQHRVDREAYTQAKQPFISRITEAALHGDARFAR